MKNPIYLDYMATTPVDPLVAAKMNECLSMSGDFGNPSSTTHIYGFTAEERIQFATQQVADAIHADPKEIVWTSGATESINLALQGAAFSYQRQGKHIVTLKTEHKAVLDTCHFLESQGFKVTYLDVERSGLVDLQKLSDALTKETIIVSVLCVNNETGIIQNIESIAKLVKSKGILLHVDAAQASGKIPIDVKSLNVDLLSLSAHKVYGPKGVGALYVRRQPTVRLQPLIYGGGHQRGLRSGTFPTHQIVGMGEAFSIAKERFSEDIQHIRHCRELLWEGISALTGIYLNADPEKTVPHCLNLRVEGVMSEALLLSLRKLAISSGAACTSANPEPSHVLMAMGLTREQIYSSIRVSLGRFTTKEDIEFTIQHFCEEVKRLRQMSPVWKS